MVWPNCQVETAVPGSRVREFEQASCGDGASCGDVVLPRLAWRSPISADSSGLGLKACQLSTSAFLDCFRVCGQLARSMSVMGIFHQLRITLTSILSLPLS